jgi:CheY-like chemotaxis protein
VLFVDDDSDTCELYNLALRQYGFDVEAVFSVERALERAMTRPDVIVTDIGLPSVDGWELIRQLRSDERTRNIPIVVLTGWAGATIRRQADEFACEAFCSKPCVPDELCQTLARILTARGVIVPGEISCDLKPRPSLA